MKTILAFVPGLLFIAMGLFMLNIDGVIGAINPGATQSAPSPVDFTLMGRVFFGLGMGFLVLFPMSARKNAQKKAAKKAAKPAA